MLEYVLAKGLVVWNSQAATYANKKLIYGHG